MKSKIQMSVYEGRGTRDEGRNCLSSIVHRCFSSVFWLLATGYWLLATGISQAQQQEKFIYDAEGRRDPFIPLLDQQAPQGLRTDFSPPEVKVKLPLEIDVKGILSKGNEYYAIINEQVMKEGQNLGEVKIKKIEANSVIVEYGQREFRLFLKKEKKQ